MTSGQPIHILVVDDEPEVRALLRTFFEREKYAVSEASDSAGLFSALDAGGIDLITLDLSLGHEDGLLLARQIWTTRNIPIVMITGKHDMIDRVVGLELGADDYISKPFHLREVLARIRMVLRRREAAPLPQPPSPARPPAIADERYAFSGWVLDVPRRQLIKTGGYELELTTAEFNLLSILVQRPGRVLSRDTIMDLLKGHDWSPVDRTIDNLVGRLRKKIEADLEAPQLIKTVRGVGYAFTADVTRP